MMETVTISKKEYEELLKKSRKLRALENGGVDNWEWYDESLTKYYDDEERRESEGKCQT